MTREEQIEVATASYINGRLSNNVPPEEIEEIRLAYQAGAIYADQNPNDEVLKLRKMFESDPDAYRLGYKKAVEKACEWLKKHICDYLDEGDAWHCPFVRTGALTDDLRKTMKEQL